VRLTGRNGSVREFKALIDAGAEYCVIPKVDAYTLGYHEAANDDPRSQAVNTVTLASHDGYCNVAMIEMLQVEIGAMSFRGIDFAAFDIPQVTGFDVMLGQSLLQFMKLEFDYSVGQLRMEEIERSAEK
jgi:predicted aspartyl protease